MRTLNRKGEGGVTAKLRLYCLSGHSEEGVISLFSHTFTSKAIHEGDQNGQCVIRSEARPRAAVSNRPAIKVDRRDLALLFRLVAVYLIYLISLIFAFRFWPLALSIAYLFWVRGKTRNAARYHGAEHMAIAAHERAGSVEIETIRSFSPVHPRCGSVHSALVLFALFLGFVASLLYLPSSLFVVFATLVLGAIIDERFGLSRLPVFAQLSWLLQHCITTKVPGNCELRTAQAALRTLLAAHQKETIRHHFYRSCPDRPRLGSRRIKEWQRRSGWRNPWEGSGH